MCDSSSVSGQQCRADRRGRATTIAAGGAFHDLRAVTVSRDGTVYVANRSQGNTVNIYSVEHGRVEGVAMGLTGANPPGIALTHDEDSLLVSGLDAMGHDQLYFVDLDTGAVTTSNQGIAANTHGGGVHRARDLDVFAWADLTARTKRKSEA